MTRIRHINYVLKPAMIDNSEAKDKRLDLTDGGGLVPEVMPSGSKTWRFKYHLNGKREKVTIGAYPTRGARLEVRVSVAQKGLLQQAAAVTGLTLSEFVVTSAQERRTV